MAGRLSVGIETNCTAPMNLERTSLRLFQIMGVDSFFLPDHYLSFIPRSMWSPTLTPAAKMIPSPDAYFDPFVMMGMMAAKYRRIRIGTGVTEPFRRHPATLAQAFVTIDHLTKGRAILGIGNGERENTEPYGIPFTKRVARLEEALQIIRLLWESRGEPVSFEGSTWRLRDALFATPLYNGKPPALWIAAHAPRMLGLTGRFADGWFPTKKMTPQEYGDCLQRIRAAAAEARRPLNGFEPGLQIQLALGTDRRTVIQQILKVPAVGAMAMLLPGPLWTRHGLQHPLGDNFEGFPEFVPETVTAEQIESARRQVTAELIGDGIVAGSVNEVVDAIRPLVAAGLRHVVIWNIGPLATGATPADLLRLWTLIRKLKKLQVPS
ncbi:MAG TPA: LLM class flavin-dependent oxidoreductase [Candidatus Acidoferrales bacterium]|nr:LLM class flavin-dependent oxidoreductase [Candidatus Acidoferrales bacterium]